MFVQISNNVCPSTSLTITGFKKSKKLFTTIFWDAHSMEKSNHTRQESTQPTPEWKFMKKTRDGAPVLRYASLQFLSQPVKQASRFTPKQCCSIYEKHQIFYLMVRSHANAIALSHQFEGIIMLAIVRDVLANWYWAKYLVQLKSALLKQINLWVSEIWWRC